MKYIYTLIISTLVIFGSVAQVTETFESATINANSFINSGITFSLTPSANVGVRNFPTAGYLNSSQYIDNYNGSTNSNPSQIKSATSFTAKSLYLYPASVAAGNTNQTAGVTLTITGKLAGVSKFNYSPLSSDFAAADWNNATNRGFSLINFATPGYDNIVIDEIEVRLGGTTIYFAIDNFTFKPAQVSYSSTTVPPGLFNATSSPNSNNRVVLADFNNDGHIDMLSQLGGPSTAVTYHQNNGNGTFASVLGTNTNPSTITSGILSGLDFIDVFSSKYYVYDFDNDGDNDIYESNSASECRYMRSNGSSFTLITMPTGLPTTVSPAFGRFVPRDYDNDGDIDVLYQLGTGVTGINVAINNGSGSFAVTAANAGGTFTSGIFNGVNMSNVISIGMQNVDVDNDGDIDILQVQNGNTNFYRNNGNNWSNAALPSGLPLTTAGSRFLPADFDADGDIDVLFQPTNTASVGIVLALNNGSGAFTNISASGVGTFSSGPFSGLTFIDIFQTLIYPADYDSDGDLDLYILPNAVAGSINYYKNGGTAPTLSSRLPLNSATGVSLNPTLSLTFNEAVFAGTSSNNIYIKRFSDDVTVATVASNSASVTGSGTTTITVSVSGLVGGTQYYVAFDDQAFKDNEGVIWGAYNFQTRERNGYRNKSFWSFTTIASCSNPVVVTQPTNSTICGAANTSFSLVATGATSYQWQLNTGTGFNNLVNGGVYSNATTSTLGITAATAGMNNYQYRCIAINGACNTTSTGATLRISVPNVSIASSTNVSCNGGSNGSIVANVPTGGVAPYSYNWTPGNPTGEGTTTISGLVANAWTINVTDAVGCTTVASATVTQPSAINSGSTLFTNITNCGLTNGAATLTGSGGLGTLEYSTNGTSWFTSTVFSGLASGSYTPRVRSQTFPSCSVSGTLFTITTPSAPSISSVLDLDITNCGLTNGRATITGTGGTGTLEYSINNSTWFTNNLFTGFGANTYSTFIRNQNSIACSATGASFTITIPSSPTISTVLDNDITNCGLTNGSATITGTGGTGTLEYSINNSTWFTSNVFTGLSANTYSTFIRNQSSIACSVTGASFTITTPSAPSISSVVDSDISNCGLTNGRATITGTGGTGTLEYSINNSNWFTSNVFASLNVATYPTYIRNQNSTACSATGASFTITTPSAPSISTVVDNDITSCGVTDGRSTITGIGGTGTLEYSINNSNWFTSNVFTNIGAATYTTYIRNQSSIACSATGASFTITAPGSPSITTVVDSDIINCGLTNGSVTITGAGGVGTLEYSINGSSWFTTTIFSNLTANTYATYVRNQSTPACSATGASFTITTPSAPTISNVLDSDISNCGLTNGSATITGTGGTGILEYSINNSNWFSSNVFTGLGVNTYTSYIRNQSSVACSATGASFIITTPSSPSISSTNYSDVTNCTSPNGSVTITGSGGTGTLEYSIDNSNWSSSNIINGLSATTYIPYIRNQSSIACSASGTSFLPISFPTTIVSHLTSQSLCGGNIGIFEVSATGSNLTYLWSNGETNASISTTALGEYMVTVTGGCGIEISNKAILSSLLGTNIISQSISQTLCGGNIATFEISTTGTNITYLWNTGETIARITTSIAGSYIVTATGTCGIEISNTFSLSINPLPNITFNPSAPKICFNTQSMITASGANSYNWNQNSFLGDILTINGTLAGINVYTVIGIDGNNCSNTALLTVTTLSEFNITADYPVIEVCLDAQPLFIGSNSTVLGITNDYFIPSIAGIGLFNVTNILTNSNNCSYSKDSGINVKNCSLTGINTTQTESLNTLTIYPNPTTGAFKINNAKIGSNLIIFNAQASAVYSQKLVLETTIITENLVSGIYLIKVGNQSVKLVVE